MYGTIQVRGSSRKAIFTCTLVGSFTTCVSAAQRDNFCVICSAVYSKEFLSLQKKSKQIIIIIIIIIMMMIVFIHAFRRASMRLQDKNIKT